MLSNSIFYHQITRKIIVAFGSLFSNIKIARQAEGQVVQTLQVPISYAPKEKWLVRIEQDPNLDSHTYTTLPRMSFEITSMAYDSARKTNRMNYISCADGSGDTIKKIYSPVPYNYDISLYILTKTQEDALQIVEQILPYFAPEYTLKVKAVPNTNITTEVPVVLNGVSIQDDYDGDFQTRRFVTYTLTFTLKASMYGPVTDAGLITTTLVDMSNPNTAPIADHTSTGDPTTGSVVSDIWNET